MSSSGSLVVVFAEYSDSLSLVSATDCIVFVSFFSVNSA